MTDTIGRLTFNSGLVYIVPGYLTSGDWSVDGLEDHSLRFLDAGSGGGFLVCESVARHQFGALHQFVCDDFWKDCEIVSRIATCGLANAMGEELGKRVLSLEHPHVPKIAFRFGYDGTRARRPQCFVTPESIDLQGESPFLIVLPKDARTPFKSAQHLNTILGEFGLSTEEMLHFPECGLIQLPWLKEMRDNTACIRITECACDSSELLMGMIIYAAELIDSCHERIAAIHVVADIEGAPRVREFWTSPPM